MRPRPQLAAETGAEELRDDADILLRQAEHLREDAAIVDDALRRLVERQLRAVPDRRRRMQLDRIVRLGRRDVGLIELDRRRRESAVGVAALALLARLRAVRRRDDVRARRPPRGWSRRSASPLRTSREPHRRRPWPSRTCRPRPGRRTGRSIGRRRLRTGGGARRRCLKTLSRDGAENLSDVSAMKDRAHTGHLLRRGGVEPDTLAVGDRRFDGHGIEHARENGSRRCTAPVPLTFSGPSTRGVSRPIGESSDVVACRHGRVLSRIRSSSRPSAARARGSASPARS